MNLIAEIMVSAFIVVGAFFLFVGSFGLAKLPDLFRRLHTPTKATTLGIGSLLIASLIYFVAVKQVAGIHELLITLFMFLTAPVSAIMIAKAHIFQHREVQRTLSPDEGGSGWGTLSAAPDGRPTASAQAPADSPASPKA